MYTLPLEEAIPFYLSVNIACPWAFLQQVTNFTGVMKFTGRPVCIQKMANPINVYTLCTLYGMHKCGSVGNK